MKPEVQAHRHAEVAAAAAKAPQELGILLGADPDDLAAGRNELGAEKVVAGEPVLRGQVTDPSPEGEAGDTR